jgi:hypothetical protein
MLNPLLDFLDALTSNVSDKKMGILETISLEVPTIPQEKDACNNIRSSVVSSSERMQPDQLLHQVGGLTCDALTDSNKECITPNVLTALLVLSRTNTRLNIYKL